MSSCRIIVYGNAGSGKSTLARSLSVQRNLAHLDLDSIAWKPGTIRADFAESKAAIDRFVGENARWVIEGCYGDLVEAALPYCEELIFLNPGVEACVRNCRARPWESHKYNSREAQDAMLAALIEWVRSYETRDDEYSLACHRRIFERFEGSKREVGCEFLE